MDVGVYCEKAAALDAVIPGERTSDLVGSFKRTGWRPEGRDRQCQTQVKRNISAKEPPRYSILARGAGLGWRSKHVAAAADALRCGMLAAYSRRFRPPLPRAAGARRAWEALIRYQGPKRPRPRSQMLTAREREPGPLGTRPKGDSIRPSGGAVPGGSR